MKSFVGVVISKVKYKDYSFIVKVYTENGLEAILVNNIKKIAPYFDYLNVLNFEVIKTKGDFYRLKNVSFADFNDTSIKNKPYKLFISEFLYQITIKDNLSIGFFNFLVKNIPQINNNQIEKFVLNFLVETLNFLGVLPQKEEQYSFFDLKKGIFIQEKPIHNYYIPKKYINFWNNIITLNFKKISIQEFNLGLKILIIYYKFHIYNFKKPKSLSLLKNF